MLDRRPEGFSSHVLVFLRRSEIALLNIVDITPSLIFVITPALKRTQIYQLRINSPRFSLAVRLVAGLVQRRRHDNWQLFARLINDCTITHSNRCLFSTKRAPLWLQICRVLRKLARAEMNSGQKQSTQY